MTPRAPRCYRFLILPLAVAYLTTALWGADTQPAATAPGSPIPGHSLHGEAFNEGPRQAAYLMGNTGNVHLSITTKVPEVQKFFDQGLGQLHGFWYFEAERSFRQAAKLDSECAMSYWGMAMANINNETRAKGFIKIAAEKKGTASPREQAWITALADFYSGADNLDARRKYIRALETLVQDQPNDAEAKALLVFHIWKNASWEQNGKKELPISSAQAVDALLDQVFQLNPLHPAHHYRIHLWDSEKPARAVVSASLNGQAAASIAHMWHMPGHTYSKLQRYPDAIWQQEASARVDHAHMQRDRVMPGQIHNYAHNNEWLIRNLIFTGQAKRARELAQNMIDIPRHPKQNNLAEGGSCAGYGRERMRQTLTQFELWTEILERENTELFQPLGDNINDEIQRLKALSLASFGTSKLEDGNRHLAALEKFLADKKSARYDAADAVEKKAREAKKEDKAISEEMAGELLKHSGGIKEIEAAVAELKAHALLAGGKIPEALSEFQKLKESSSLAKNTLARALSLCNDHEAAVDVARKAVEKGINEVLPQATLVEVLHRAGKIPEATTEFAKLRTLAGSADIDLPIFARLKPLAETLQYPADWRMPQPASTDVGVRPDLNSLGPFGWQPSPAPPFSLTAGNGETVTLEQFRGKPVVVIFYLGSGCLHCMEQLQKFSAKQAEYAAVGLNVIAISSESMESLKKSIENFGQEKAIKFPLAPDPGFEAFKKYRAFDDFENQPLHGTFLIDGEGSIRWQEISFEPFSDPDFLLKESRRLLKIQ